MLLWRKTELYGWCRRLTAAQKKALQPKIITLDTLEGAVVQGLNYQRATFALNDLSVSTSYGWSFTPANSELIDYLSSKHMRKQLEFTDDQNNEFKSIQKEYSKAYQELYAKYPELKKKDLPSEERKKLNKTVMLEGQKLRKKFNEKLKETLVPHQVSMVRTLKFKQAVQMYGFSHALTKKPFADEIKTTDEQKKEIEKIRRESQAAISKKIEEMKAKAKADMLKVLDAKQRKVLKEIEGEAK